MTEVKTKIAVVCAHLPERNTGMLTVDLAAHTVLPKHFPDAEITLYAFSRGEENPYGDDEAAHGYLNILDHEDQFLKSDVFLYWGDFIQSHSYWEFDMNIWNHSLQKLDESARLAQLQKLAQQRSKYIFLSGLTSEQKKQAVVFGSTIITNDASAVHDREYEKDFNNFFESAGAIFLRDALSAAKISHLRNNQATLACDCAFLLDDESLSELPGFSKAAKKEGVGVFLGRSPSKIKMLFLATLISKTLGEKANWLPWFSSSKKLKFAAKFLGYDVATEGVEPGMLLSALSGYKYIVTDTYHVCVNAWRMGIPAVCIGKGADGAVNSLADKKKEILYEMYGARQLYVFLENIWSPFTMISEAKRVSKLLLDKAFTEKISGTIQSHRSMALNRLLEAMKVAIGRAN